jgi:hypothetical protein
MTKRKIKKNKLRNFSCGRIFSFVFWFSVFRGQWKIHRHFKFLQRMDDKKQRRDKHEGSNQKILHVFNFLN